MQNPRSVHRAHARRVDLSVKSVTYRLHTTVVLDGLHRGLLAQIDFPLLRERRCFAARRRDVDVHPQHPSAIALERVLELLFDSGCSELCVTGVESQLDTVFGGLRHQAVTGELAGEPMTESLLIDRATSSAQKGSLAPAGKLRAEVNFDILS